MRIASPRQRTIKSMREPCLDSWAAPLTRCERLLSKAQSVRMSFMCARFRGRRCRRRNPLMRVLRQRRAPTAGGPCDRAATAKYEVFAITINGRNTMGVVAVDLERGVPVWNVITGTGTVHRNLPHNNVTARSSRRSRKLTNTSGETLWPIK
jgi:hypothetical protein